MAPVAIRARDVEHEQREAKRRASEDRHRRPHLEEVHKDAADAEDCRLRRVVAVFDEEAPTRGEDEADRRRVHADERAADPRVLPCRLPEGHDRVDEKDARAKQAKEAKKKLGWN